jgi:hypothetical protein
MTVKSGIIEKVQMKEETVFGDGGDGDSVEFGYIKKLSWSAETNTSANYSVDGSHNPNTLTDGVLAFSGGLEWDLTDGRELECIFGTLTDAGAGSFTLATANELPSYGFYGVLDSDTNANGKGFKFSRVTLNGSKGATINCTSDFVGQNVISTATTVSPQTPTEKPLTWLDASVTINGGVTVDLEDFNLTIDRNTEARRGIEATDTDERRLITAVYEKNLSLTGSFSAIAKKEIFEAVLGGTTIEDYRTPANIVFTLGNDTNTLVLTVNGLLTTTNRDTGAEDELITMSFDIIGKSVSGSGTYTV